MSANMHIVRRFCGFPLAPAHGFKPQFPVLETGVLSVAPSGFDGGRLLSPRSASAGEKEEVKEVSLCGNIHYTHFTLLTCKKGATFSNFSDFFGQKSDVLFPHTLHGAYAH